MRGSGNEEAVGGPSDSSRVPWIVFGVALAVITAWLIHLGQGTTFFRDEWSVILDRDGTSFESYMWSHGGQQIWGQVFVFINGLKLFGFDDYAVFRVLTVPLVAGASVLMYVVGRRRLGPWFAIAPALAVPLMGSSYLNLLWPLVTMTYVGPAFLGVGSFLALERRTIAGDAGACAMLLIALGLSGFALPFLAGAAVGVVFVAGREWRRLWVPAVPAIVYLLWSNSYGTQEIHFTEAVKQAPSFIGDMAVAAIEGLTGFSGAIAVLATVFTFGLIAVRLYQLRGDSLIAWQATVTLAAFWILTASARTGVSDPKTSRYIFPSAFLIVLILVAVAPRGRFRLAYAVTGSVLVLAFVPHGIRELVDGSDYLKSSGDYTRAEFGAAEIGRGAIDPAMTLPLTSYPVVAGSYFSAIDRYDSSPAMTPAELEAASPVERKFADRLLATTEGIDGGPDGSEPDAAYVKTHDLVCRPLPQGQTVTSDDISWRPLTALGPAALTVRRFADTPDLVPAATEVPGRQVLSAPGDTLADPVWEGTVTAIGKSVRVCETGK